ncbi:hypothetical protein [Leptospira jelokensis]|uniref:hypothetical protein n=1 Tax=Leptospira jelokensis TaxID=2484931 RepID=UPI00109171AA|nr:hypothetical protein [Leptospira jelokensis]TGL99200.1 hypothetical protein EHQ79_15400 [Leptospira jelokensis]
MTSIAIVASTLPLPLLSRLIQSEKIKVIYVGSESLSESCLAIRNIQADLKIKVIPKTNGYQILYWFLVILKSKILKHNIIFFHECCMPFFDLFISLVKPKSKFFPQVTMEGSIEIRVEEMPKSKIISFLKNSGLSKKFAYYLSPSVGDNPEEYVMQYRNYPSSVKIFSVSHSRTILFQNPDQLIDVNCNRILLLLGKGMVSDTTQRIVFLSIIDLLEKLNFQIFIKDHPNPKFRLNLETAKGNHLRQEVPVELAGTTFSWVIGFSSTAIINYGNRGISVLNLLEGVSIRDYELVKKHFDEINPNHKILYPQSMDELAKILGQNI